MIALLERASGYWRGTDFGYVTGTEIFLTGGQNLF